MLHHPQPLSSVHIEANISQDDARRLRRRAAADGCTFEREIERAVHAWLALEFTAPLPGAGDLL